MEHTGDFCFPKTVTTTSTPASSLRKTLHRRPFSSAQAFEQTYLIATLVMFLLTATQRHKTLWL